MEEQKARSGHFPAQYVMRYYQDEFPTENELVMGQSEKSEENGCYVALLEYNNKLGMMPINEYTTAMKKNIHRAMKTGKREILRVLRVDRQKGYIDLSKKRLTAEQENQGEEKYTRSTLLHSILIHVSQTCKIPILELYQVAVWPLYKNPENKHPLSYFKNAVTSEEEMAALAFPNDDSRRALFEEIKRRFKRPIVKTMANISVSIGSYKGVNAIKHVLEKGIEAGKERGFDVKIVIIGAPKYICEVSSTTVEAGKEVLKHTMAAIREAVAIEKGTYSTDREPYIVGDTNMHIKEMIDEEKEKERLVLDDNDEDMGNADD